MRNTNQYLSFSWLKLINNFLQLLFIRLTKCEEKIIESFEITHGAVVPFTGNFTIGGMVQKYRVVTWYSIQGFIVPFTGWESDFWYIGSPKFLRISKKVTVYQ